MANKKRNWNNDYYSKRARDEKFRARSVYKLQEIDDKFKLLKKGHHILDLGCAPGSWLQYIIKKTAPNGKAVGIDLKECAVPGATVHTGDIMEFEPEDFGGRFDGIVSDMAPDTSGSAFVDAQRSLQLCEQAFSVAEKLLKAGGYFIIKIFQGEDVEDFFRRIKPRFNKLTRFKPKSSRDISVEIFIIGTGFKTDHN